MQHFKMRKKQAFGNRASTTYLFNCLDWWSCYNTLAQLLAFSWFKQGEKHNFLALILTSGCVQPTCEVRVVRGVNEIVREGEGHVFALVQLLRRDDAVLLAAQIPGEAFHRDLTCTETRQRVTINTNESEQCMCALQKFCAKGDEG